MHIEIEQWKVQKGG